MTNGIPDNGFNVTLSNNWSDKLIERIKTPSIASNIDNLYGQNKKQFIEALEITELDGDMYEKAMVFFDMIDENGDGFLSESELTTIQNIRDGIAQDTVESYTNNAMDINVTAESIFGGDVLDSESAARVLSEKYGASFSGYEPMEANGSAYFRRDNPDGTVDFLKVIQKDGQNHIVHTKTGANGDIASRAIFSENQEEKPLTSIKHTFDDDNPVPTGSRTLEQYADGTSVSTLKDTQGQVKQTTTAQTNGVNVVETYQYNNDGTVTIISHTTLPDGSVYESRRTEHQF